LETEPHRAPKRNLAGLAAATIIWLLASVSSAPAWWAGGHGIVSRAAAKALPDDVPAFFRKSADALAHYSLDPDLWKNRATPHLTDREYPEHFIDWELLKGRPLPPLRWQYVALCNELGLNPRRAGFLPYAIAENTERLAFAFAEYRRRPENPYVRRKCLVYGGILAHYTADLAQPLHLTIHWDGRARAGEPSPRTGIHDRMDALIQAVAVSPSRLAKEVRPAVFDDLFTSIVRQIEENRRAIDSAYELEQELPVLDKHGRVARTWRPTKRVREFAFERAKAATFVTASCWLTAWERSSQIKIPSWAMVKTNQPVTIARRPGRPVWLRAAIAAVLALVVTLSFVRRKRKRSR